MKKFILLIITILSYLQSLAQININGGYIQSLDRISTNESSVSFPGRGFYAGAGFNIMSASNPQISFCPGLNFALLNIKVNEEEFKETFFTAPLHIKYTENLTSDGPIVFISVGPSLICPVEGEKIDITVGLEAGLLSINSHLRFIVGFDIGTINRASGTNSRYTRNILHLGVGYTF